MNLQDLWTLIRQLQALAMVGDESLRTVRGVVGADGSTTTGTGFSVSKLATGEFRVTFDTSFSDVPAVTGSPRMGGASSSKTFEHDTEAATASAFRCSVRDSTTGATVDDGFHFVAVGAR